MGAARAQADYAARLLHEALKFHMRHARRENITHISDVDCDDNMDAAFWFDIDGETVMVECKPWPKEG